MLSRAMIRNSDESEEDTDLAPERFERHLPARTPLSTCTSSSLREFPDPRWGVCGRVANRKPLAAQSCTLSAPLLWRSLRYQSSGPHSKCKRRVAQPGVTKVI